MARKVPVGVIIIERYLRSRGILNNEKITGVTLLHGNPKTFEFTVESPSDLHIQKMDLKKILKLNLMDFLQERYNKKALSARLHNRIIAAVNHHKRTVDNFYVSQHDPRSTEKEAAYKATFVIKDLFETPFETLESRNGFGAASIEELRTLLEELGVPKRYPIHPPAK